MHFLHALVGFTEKKEGAISSVFKRGPGIALYDARKMMRHMVTHPSLRAARTINFPGFSWPHKAMNALADLQYTKKISTCAKNFFGKLLAGSKRASSASPGPSQSSLYTALSCAKSYAEFYATKKCP